MKNLLRLEELFMLVISLYGLYFLHAAWWVYLLLFIGPDISMLGYLAGSGVGAACYNLFHHKGIAVLMILLGLVSNQQTFLVIGIVLFGHSSMDRFFGYGLKYSEGFKYTHLGKIGKE